MKTSLDYDDYRQFTGDAFRRQQAAVLALIPVGGKVRSPNAKVTQDGLVPDVPFPPLRLDLIFALPGQPFHFQTIAPGTPVPSGEPL